MRNLDKKAQEITALKEKQKDNERRIVDLNKGLDSLAKATKEADSSWKRLDDKIQKLEKSKKLYPEKVKEIVNENEEAKALLDTRLPDDLKRLLNESITPK